MRNKGWERVDFLRQIIIINPSCLDPSGHLHILLTPHGALGLLTTTHSKAYPLSLQAHQLIHREEAGTRSTMLLLFLGHAFGEQGAGDLIEGLRLDLLRCHSVDRKKSLSVAM